MTNALAEAVSFYLDEPVTGTESDKGISLVLATGESLFIRPGQPVCAKACAVSLRFSQLLRRLHDSTIEEGIKPEEQRLLDRLN